MHNTTTPMATGNPTTMHNGKVETRHQPRCTIFYQKKLCTEMKPAQLEKRHTRNETEQICPGQIGNGSMCNQACNSTCFRAWLGAFARGFGSDLALLDRLIGFLLVVPFAAPPPTVRNIKTGWIIYCWFIEMHGRKRRDVYREWVARMMHGIFASILESEFMGLQLTR
jgi:hypothetical protein